MSLHHLDPEEALFTNLAGQRAQVQDIIDEGLDGGYENRVPSLTELLVSGEPYHRFLAAAMLTAWGYPTGFQVIINWASDPSSVPWREAPVSFDRISGADSAFETLADSIYTSFWLGKTPELRNHQIAALQAFLHLYHAKYFGRTLALAIVRDLSVTTAVEPDIRQAIETGLAALQGGKVVEFDLAFQIACLLIPLILVDEQAAVSYAERLITQYPNRSRMLREVASALGGGKTLASAATLKRLGSMDSPALKREVNSALARRLRQSRS